MAVDSIEQVSVIGAGTMGHGIAIVFASSGRQVQLFDVDETALDDARGAIGTGFETLLEADRLSNEEVTEARNRIEYSSTYEEAVSEADLVIEASPEDIDIKKDVFRQLDEHAPSDAILASNTSGLSITDIASAVEEPERVLGTHWFNPPYIVPLVEVVHGEHTNDDVAEQVYELLDSIGKTPVLVKKDIRGFIANRIQLAMDYEAWSLLDRGIASAEDIDRAVKAGFGLRVPALGVFKKSDFAGLDVIHDIQSYMTEDLDRGTEPSETVSELISDGKYGLKSGEGVYDWSDRPVKEVTDERDQQLLSLVELYEDLEDD